MKKSTSASLIAVLFSTVLASAGLVLADENTKVSKESNEVTNTTTSDKTSEDQKESKRTEGTVSTDERARKTHTRRKAGKVGKDAAGDAAGNPDYPRGLPSSKPSKE